MQPLLVIIGPTASGKSDLAIDLAGRYNGEVISADSRQVYRHLNQTTGKVTKEEMRGIPHHLIDTVEPGNEYSAYDFAQDAIRSVKDIVQRGSLPIVVGGSGFYIDALLFHGSVSNVPKDDVFRRRAEKQSLRLLQTDLQQQSPNAYKRIDIENPHRLIRALEIIRSLGFLPKQKRTPRYPYTMVGITHNTVHLKDRIERRLDDRFAAMTAEIKALLDRGVDPRWLDSLGLECRHITAMLTKHTDEETTRKNLLKAIAAYAKRQRTWWKRYPEAAWYQENEYKKLRYDLDTIYTVNHSGSTRART